MTCFFGHYLLKTDIICQVLDIIDVILRDIISPTSKSRGWFVLKKVSCIFHQTMLECSLRSGSCMYLWGKTKVTGWALSTNSGDLMLSWNSNRIYYRPSNVQETRPSKMDNSTGIYKKNQQCNGWIDKKPIKERLDTFLGLDEIVQRYTSNVVSYCAQTVFVACFILLMLSWP